MSGGERTRLCGGPRVELDEQSLRAIRPTWSERARTNLSEVKSALGLEGAFALAVFALCSGVLAYGLIAAARTWASDTRMFHLLIVRTGPSIPLAALWFAFIGALALSGWLLSNRVTKKTLRIFVALGIVIGGVLLISIGRTARVDAATSDAASEARRLLAAVADDREVEIEQQDLALVALLCKRGNLITLDDDGAADDAECKTAREKQTAVEDNLGDIVSEGDSAGLESGDDLETVNIDGDGVLSCVPGWTVETLLRWLDDASLDRQVAALSAIASCEIRVANPEAEAAAAELTADDRDIEQTVDEAVEQAVGEAVPTTVAQTRGPTTTTTVPPTSEAEAAARDSLLTQRSEVLALDAISNGADELLTYASGSTRFAEFRFSGAAWLVLLAATVLWYRHLEIRAGRGRLGPIDVQFDAQLPAEGRPPQGEGEHRPPKNRAEAVFKESVIRNVPEPGAMPGASALAPVGDLVAQTDVPQKWLVSSVIEAVRTVFATRGGYTVIFSTRDEAGPDGTSFDVAFVRLRDNQTGNQLCSHIVYESSPERAARQAGYWVAGWIIKRSRYVPEWARWGEDEAPTLARLAELRAGGPRSAQEMRPDDFDPNVVNGLVLAKRAYARQIYPRSQTEDGSIPVGGMVPESEKAHAYRDHFGALEDFARAVHRQRRYPVARYRRGAVLATMMFRGGDLWKASGLHDVPKDAKAADWLPRANRLRYLLDDLLLADRERERTPEEAQSDADLARDWATSLLGNGPGTAREFPPEMRRRYLRLVIEWSHRNRAAVRWSLLARLRPSERDFWKEFRKGKLERDWALLLDSELCICAERLRDEAQREGTNGERDADLQRTVDKRMLKLEESVRDRAMAPDSHWQIAYNLACLASIRTYRWTVAGADHEAFAGLAGSTAKTRDDRIRDCGGEAQLWLDRCLDRSASEQLVRQWVVADGDLRALREGEQLKDEFWGWTSRVRSIDDDEHID